MAYQPKSYRKFLAGTITAAVVASAVAPAASAAEVKFPDLAGLDQETTAAIEALVGLGVIVGQPDGKFAPNKTINRGQAAEMIVKALPNVEPKANPTGKVFEDLTEKSYSSKFAEALVDAKLIPAGGKFGAGTGMTREAMAVTLVAAFGLTDTGAAVEVKDLDKAAEASRAAIKILAQHGLTKLLDGNFNPTADVTRSQFALFFYRAVQAVTVAAPEVTEIKSVNETTLQVKVKGDLKEVKASDFTFDNGLTVSDAKIVTAPAAAADTFTTVELTTSKQEAGKTYKLLTFKGAEVKTEVKVEVSGAPVVTSAKALNNIQVELTFNTELDKDTVVKANFADNSTSIDIDTVQLVDSNKVLVTFNAAFANQTSVKLTLNGVKAANGLAVAKDTTSEVNFFDVTVPTVTKVASAGPDSFKITFSEPVSTTAASVVSNYSINDGQFFIQSATRTALNEVTVRLYSTLADGEYKVKVKNVEDLAGFKVTETTLTLNQVADKELPVVANVVSASPEKVVLEFNEDITLTDSAVNLLSKVYHTNANNTPNNIEVDSTNSKRVVLTFTSNKLPQGGTAYLVIDKDLVKDGWNNKNVKYTNNITVTVDNVKPTVKKLESATDASFKLTFSEDVDSTTAQNVANYTVLDSTGKKVTTAINSAVRNSTTNSVVTLTMAASLPGGVYTIVAENVKDLAGNVIDKASTNVEVKDSTAPTVTADGTLYAGKKIFKVSFSEPMATSGAGSVLDLANYKYGASYLNTVEGVTVTLTDSGKAVLVDYSKSNLTVSNSSTVTVGKVSDASGNYTTSFTSNVTVTDATTVAISGVQATGTKTIKVTLDDSLTKFNAADFVLKQGGVATTPASVTFANVDGKGVITYTLQTALRTDATTAVTVETVASTTSENAFGVKVGGSLTAVTAVDKIAPVLAKFDHDTNPATDTVEDIQLSFTDLDADGKVDTNETASITLTFSEAMKTNSFSTQSFKVAGFTVTSVGFAAGDTKVVLTVSADANNTAVSSTIEQVADVQDNNSVVLVKGGSWTVR
jgi:trimeric autotransporter adhesin